MIILEPCNARFFTLCCDCDTTGAVVRITGEGSAAGAALSCTGGAPPEKEDAIVGLITPEEVKVRDPILTYFPEFVKEYFDDERPQLG